MEKAGGKCLPCVVDIRDDSQLEDAVERAVDKFGGIDVVVNNASAIHLSGTVDTPMKRYIHAYTCIIMSWPCRFGTILTRCFFSHLDTQI